MATVSDAPQNDLGTYLDLYFVGSWGRSPRVPQYHPIQPLHGSIAQKGLLKRSRMEPLNRRVQPQGYHQYHQQPVECLDLRGSFQKQGPKTEPNLQGSSSQALPKVGPHFLWKLPYLIGGILTAGPGSKDPDSYPAGGSPHRFFLRSFLCATVILSEFLQGFFQRSLNEIWGHRSAILGYAG